VDLRGLRLWRCCVEVRACVSGWGGRVRELLERGSAMVSLFTLGLGGGARREGEREGCSGRSGSSSCWRCGWEGVLDGDGGGEDAM